MWRKLSVVAALSLAWGCETPPERLDSKEGGTSERAEEKDAPAKMPKGSISVINEEDSNSIPLEELAKLVTPETIESDDPYYKKKKRYEAFPLGPTTVQVFGMREEDIKSSTFLFTASDGYAVRFSGEQLLHPAAYLAFADADEKDWQPIGDQKANPGPLYMVWKGKEFSDEKKYPRPWAIVKMERLTGADRFEHTRPKDGFGDNKLAKRGYELFAQDCIRCHAINQEGGSLGPDLNVPQNILAYRPEEQVRAHIKNPKQFRYSAMPAHPDLTDEDLDALIAYLRLMGEHQHDPHAEKDTEKADE